LQLLGAEKTMGKIRIPVSDKNVDGQNQNSSGRREEKGPIQQAKCEGSNQPKHLAKNIKRVRELQFHHTLFTRH
jgi:hypothetical protein